MILKTVAKIAAALVLGVSLTGCLDVEMDVEILSETDGRATTTMTVGADIYPMLKMANAQEEGESGSDFCTEEGAILTENADGSATCVMTSDGKFAELETGGDGEGPKFEVVSPGVVKVTLATGDVKSELGEEVMDEQSKAMMASFFAGKNFTVRIRGKEIVESNMTISGDRKSAEIVIPFLDIVNGAETLPDEITATVKTN